jgi:hypothetical protein
VEDNRTNPAPARHANRGRLPKLRINRGNRQMLFTLVLILAIAGCVYLFIQNRNKDEQLKNPTAATQAQNQELVSRVGQLLQLPEGEPTVATVSDASKLKDEFYKNAQNGDKVLFYVKGKKAILYRPSTNKIINVAPLTINNSNTKR